MSPREVYFSPTWPVHLRVISACFFKKLIAPSPTCERLSRTPWTGFRPMTPSAATETVVTMLSGMRVIAVTRSLRFDLRVSLTFPPNCNGIYKHHCIDYLRLPFKGFYGCFLADSVRVFIRGFRRIIVGLVVRVSLMGLGKLFRRF